MLPFQKTQVYNETLEVIYDILQKFDQKNAPVIREKIEEEGITVTTNVAKAFARRDSHLMDIHFEKASESILGIVALLDLAVKNSSISEDEKETIYSNLDRLKNNIATFKQRQKKILILSAELGQGHMSAAKAIKEAIEYNYGYDYNVEIIDFQQLLSSFINTFTKKTYENWIKFTPTLYKLLYESTNKKIPFVKLLNQFNYPFVLNKLTKFYKEKQPDLLISTFPVWSYLASEIWKKTKKDAKFISVITDSITIHKSWVIADTDYHIVANNDTAQSLNKLGIKNEKIKILGFPVSLDFLEETDREKFLKNIGLNPKKFTILFLPTSQQQRKNIKIIRELSEQDQKYNIIIITGRDSKLKPKLEKFAKKKNIKTYGWTDSMPKFIQASDLVVTKAGGATVMECIAAKKPLIITSIVPGQEMGNAKLINKYHLGIIANSTTTDIVENVEFIRKNYATYSRNINKISKPKAALQVAEFLSKLLEN